MPRDWMREERGREERRDRWDERRDWRDTSAREDYGQADFSNDYAYDPDRRAGYRAEEDVSRRDDDFGQADYSTDFAYDADRGRAYRRFTGEDRSYAAPTEADRIYGRRMDQGEYRRGQPPHEYWGDRAMREEGEHRDERIGERGRSWKDRAGAFFTGRDERAEVRRRGPSDRVLWAVIVERLEDERGLDLRDLEVLVENGEVTLNGTVRRKDDKRRIEDIADMQGVRHVQNNLRVRETGRRWFG